MNQKKAKKFRKEVRRRVDENFGAGMQSLVHILRKRPQWVPKRLWVLLYLPLFPKKYIKVIYKYIA